ncbi:MAG TPA: hypothetical protein PKN48_00120 [Bacteroidales bacterium]|nr:hypothetical protein [Bacteroidales bacterium]
MSVTAIFGALSMMIGTTVISNPFKSTPATRLNARITALELEIGQHTSKHAAALKKVQAAGAALRLARARALEFAAEIESLKQQLSAVKAARAVKAESKDFNLDAKIPGEI